MPVHEQYRRLTAEDFPALSALHRAYKEAIGEAAPTDGELSRLRDAMDRGNILLFGCETEGRLAGVCSVTRGFSTYDYRPSGVLEDFYIQPELRHRGIARRLVRFAREESGVSTLTVGCAPCDRGMYEAIGFRALLGELLAWSDGNT